VFTPLVFGTFGGISSNLVGLVGTTLEYGVDHLCRNMAAITIDTMRAALRKRYRTRLSMATWRGYANLFLDRTKYVGTCHIAPNMRNTAAA
jgi:hypothetical protein